jgi:peptide chain release factor subunit 1
MIDLEDLRNFARFDASPHLILSVYLNLHPERQKRRAYQLVFKDLVKQVENSLDKEQQRALEPDVNRINEYLAMTLPHGNGLVIFSCTPHDIWRVYYLPMPIADDVHVGTRPYTRRLLDVLDEYERYAVALVDKERARLFTIYLGEIEEEEDAFDFVPGKHEQGGWSQANYQRHHEAHVHWHLKHVAEQLATILRTRPFDRLVLAGPEEATSELRNLLSKPLQARLVGLIPAEIFANKEEILQQTLEIERQIERANEERLVAEVIDQGGKGEVAVRGVAETLAAIARGQVHRLVVAEGLHLAGAECSCCGYLLADGQRTCPVCGAEVTPLDDIVERAIERTLDERGHVEIVHDDAASRLCEFGGMGAILRFALPTPLTQPS